MNKPTYFIEMTDTFGGEANYCWVNRFLVSASSPRGAMRRVCARTGDSVRFQYGASDAGETQRWDSTRGCVCYFVECLDADGIESVNRNYSRIEVL